MYRGQILSVDLSASAPISMKVLSFDDKQVKVEYLDSTPGRIEYFNLADFRLFIGEKEFNKDCVLCEMFDLNDLNDLKIQ